MPLEQTPLRPIEVSYRCDVCGEGHYRHLPNNLCVNPLGLKSVEGWFNKAYIHQCDACGDERIFSEVYPHIQYETEGVMDVLLANPSLIEGKQ